VIELLIATVFLLNADARTIRAAEINGGTDQLLQDRVWTFKQSARQPLQASHLHSDVSDMKISPRECCIAPQIEDLKAAFLDSDLHRASIIQCSRGRVHGKRSA